MATSPGQLDSGFNPYANGTTWAVAPQADGRLVFAGAFSEVGGMPRNRITRTEVDGMADGGFNPGSGAGRVSVYTVAVQPDGKVVIAGDFTQVAGVTRNRVARLNADGSLDADFNPDVGGAGSPYVVQLAIQDDGKVVIVGEFDTVAGVTRNNIARLNPDGSLDASFNPNADQLVAGVDVQPDGALVVGGAFSNVGGAARQGTARLNPDGSADGAFAPVALHNGLVATVAVQPDGKVIIAGTFTQVTGATPQRIARLNADGSLDTAFDPGSNGAIVRLALQPDGKILAGGDFTEIAGATRSHLARLSPDGTFDGGFIDTGLNAAAEGMALQPDGKLVAVGNFTLAGTTARGRIARFHATVPTVAPGGVGATAGEEHATVSWAAVPGEISSYTATASPGGRNCTTTSTTCTVTGLTAGTPYTFTVTAANQFGSGPASSASGAVTPGAPQQPAVPTLPGPESGQPQAESGTVGPAPRRLAGRTSLRRGVATTTGTAPRGATRIIQTARTGGSAATQGFLEMARAKRATGRCRITLVRSKKTKKVVRRNYRCTIKLTKGTWTVTTTARGKAAVVAQGTRRVRVR